MIDWPFLLGILLIVAGSLVAAVSLIVVRDKKLRWTERIMAFAFFLIVGLGIIWWGTRVAEGI